MAYFENATVTLEVPDDWVDNTAAVYAERVADGLGATIALVRTPMLGTDTLKARAGAAARKLLFELPEAKIFEENWFELDGIPAVQLLAEWKHAAGKVTQLITMFAREGTFWTFTATAPSARLDALDPVLQQVLGSLRVAKVAPAPER